MLTTEVREVFAVLRPALTEIVASAPEVDASFLRGAFPPDEQRAFAERVVATLGFESGAWRLDPTAHPFCTSFTNRDVRLTTRYQPDDLESVWSTLHEAGHGLYAHGIADSLLRTPLDSAPSLGVNESQSRTWENLVGRSRPFWEHWYEPLQETFPHAARRRPRRLRPRDQPRRAGADPGRRRRDDVQPPHHPPLRARAGADRGDRRARGPARGVERADEGVPRRRRPERRRRRPPGRPLVGRRARLLPDLRARQRDLAPALATSSGRRCPTSTTSSPPATRCRSPTGSATTSTRSAAS